MTSELSFYTGKPNVNRFIVLVWFDLVSLFNGISTFVGYSMPKPFPEKNNSGTISGSFSVGTEKIDKQAIWKRIWRRDQDKT